MKTAIFALGLALAGSCAAFEVDESQITTPDEALAALKAGNERFISGKTLNQDYHRQIEKTASGQAPYATILSCLDSRIPPEILFDQGIGDIFVGRVAGNVEEPNLLGSFEFATEVKETRLLVVMGHTSCGAVGGACADVELGNLSGLLDQIKPAILLASAAHPNVENVCAAEHIDHVAEANVRKTIADIREQSPVMSKREAAGTLKIVGAMYNVTSGKVTFFDDQPPVQAQTAL